MVTDREVEAVVSEVGRRALITPSLVAVRVFGEAITFGDLDRSIREYTIVMDARGLSPHAAFFAALLHCAPSLASVIDGKSCERVLDDVVTWLGRGIDTGGADGLRAVG
ncbi:hypothetical protein [Gordonia sp. NPDC003376]